MKTEIVKTEQANEIDWSKPMIVKNIKNSIILTNGKHTDKFFVGVIIYSEQPDSIGLYYTDWLKSNFTPITEPITIKFIP